MLRGTQETRARTAVVVAFAVNGFAFASWVSRIPLVRENLQLTPGRLGALLLALSVGSLVAQPISGLLVHRFGPARVVGSGAVLAGFGLSLAGVGARAGGEVAVTAAGLLMLGFGSGVWDVAMNVEGAQVERRLGRSIMPRFHAAFSLGTVAGAVIGATAAALHVPTTVHLPVMAVAVVVLPVAATRVFLPVGHHIAERDQRHPLRAWTEPRTLVLGLMVLALALTEGVANDWLALGLVDGYGVPAWLGAAGFGLFVAAMTAGRLAGTATLDRFGRVPALWSTMTLAVLGVLLVVFGQVAGLVVAGILLWGTGASLGFPVGVSAAADDPSYAAARVSVVSTIGYTAFFAGPPLVGFLGDHVGVLHALLVVAVVLLPAAFAVPATRPLRPHDGTP